MDISYIIGNGFDINQRKELHFKGRQFGSINIKDDNL